MGYKNTDACLAKVSEDEPIFVLRAQDITAPDIIREWAMKHVLRLGAHHPKIIEAYDCAEAMEAWHTRKLPD